MADPKSIKFSSKSNADNPSAEIITVVRDPEHVLGKQFALSSDGGIDKRAAVSLSFGIACMHEVNTLDDLVALLTEVGEDPRSAIINAVFTGVEIGEPFLILSERQIEERLGIPRGDRDRQKGVHLVDYHGKQTKALGRFKENVLPSCWQYLDRDIDEHTPADFASLSLEEWRQAIAKFLPGLEDINCLHLPSTSSRVVRDGEPIGKGNGHLWFRVADPADIERFRTAAMVQAAVADMTWLKPRCSRMEPGKVIGHSLTTLFDPSVFTPGRLVFVGKPTVSAGLTVGPQEVTILPGALAAFDTATVALPDEKSVRTITRKAGVEMQVQGSGSSLVVTANDLTLDTEIETEDQGVLSIRDCMKKGITQKVRCQTPFRASSSFAAFLNLGADGMPFVHDVGTCISHWLSQSERDELILARAKGVCARLIERARDDCGAPFEPEAIDALIEIRNASPAEYQRLRSELKRTNRQISVVALDRAIQQRRVEDDMPETHNGFAQDLIRSLTVDEFAPIGHDGLLYTVDSQSSMWIGRRPEDLTRMVAESYDGLANCKRSGDYSSIAQLSVTLASDPDFFTDAPIGLACPSGFYRLNNDEVMVEPLSPHHRQRVQLGFDPSEQPTPLFDQFLDETFESANPDEEKQQRILLQEIVGAVMLGIMHRYQKAVVFFDPFGRAGKGTMEKIIRALVPSSFVTAISPFHWGREYYLASLVAARLNVVGELPDHDAIPAAAFKSVIGGDLLTGRHPNHRTITFKNEAAHVFMSNHLINTRDHSEAFFARWLIVEFPNSRLRLGLPIDPSLAERIIAQEMPGIAHWALLGAMRLLRQGKFSTSMAHDRLMAKWRRTANSLEEFIDESCQLDEGHKVRRSVFYRAYREWCTDNGRRPFAKGKVRDLLEHNIGLGVRLAKLDGHELFRGICLLEDSELNLMDLNPSPRPSAPADDDIY